MQRILGALDRHARMFDLSGPLGRDLLDVARRSVATTFDRQYDPDGTPWEPLSNRYARAKERTHPGRPMGVRSGDMKAGLSGRTTQQPARAEWVAGSTDVSRRRLSYFTEGDDAQNRPPRRVVGLSPDGRNQAREILDKHFKDQR